MDPKEVVTRILKALPDAIVDIDGEGCSFELFIISDEFEGLNSLKRQQLILGQFIDELRTGKLHALSIKARTAVEIQQGSGLVQISL